MLQAENITKAKLFYMLYVLYLYGNLRGVKKTSHVQYEHFKSQPSLFLACSALVSLGDAQLGYHDSQGLTG